MDKHYSRLPISLILCTLFVFCTMTAFSEGITSVGASTADIYSQMTNLFVIGERTDDFSAAMQIYDENPSLKTWADAEKYYRYMQARTYLKQGSFSDAGVLFESLKEFRDSIQYSAYTKGRIAESEGHFEDAVGYYLTAADLNRTDCVTRLQACNAKINDERTQNQYVNAVIEFETGLQNNDPNTISAVLKVFESLGDYSNSRIYAERCGEWLKAANRKIDISVTAEANSATVAWTDTMPGEKYTVKWRPEATNAYEEIKNAESPVNLINLIPGTTYELKIEAEDSSATAEQVFPTSLAKPVAQNQFKLVRFEIAGIQTQGGILDLVSPADVFNDYHEFLYKQPENGFSDSELNGVKLFGGVVLQNLTGQDEILNVMAVLRPDLGGVYYTNTEVFKISSENTAKMMCIELDGAIQKLVNDRQVLSKGAYLVEIYINGSYFCSGGFNIR